MEAIHCGGYFDGGSGARRGCAREWARGRGGREGGGSNAHLRLQQVELLVLALHRFAKELLRRP